MVKGARLELFGTKAVIEKTLLTLFKILVMRKQSEPGYFCDLLFDLLALAIAAFIVIPSGLLLTSPD